MNTNRRPTEGHKTRRRVSRRPPDVCPTCGSKLRITTSALALPVNGERIVVPTVPHYDCPHCHEKLLDAKQDGILTSGAIERYRRKHGLLAAEDIRAIRKKYGMTQAEFARLLRLGSNTLSRWEANRYVQTESMDVLLRLIRYRPENLSYLRRRAP